MNDFWNSPTYQIIKAMKRTGNQKGVVNQWKRAVEQWANNEVNNPDAVAIRAWLPMWQVRPFYTAEELAPLWPMLAVALGIVDKPFPAPGAARLRHMLDFGGLPWFFHGGKIYHIVERLHYWSKADIKEIENVFNG